MAAYCFDSTISLSRCLLNLQLDFSVSAAAKVRPPSVGSPHWVNILCSQIRRGDIQEYRNCLTERFKKGAIAPSSKGQTAHT